MSKTYKKLILFAIISFISLAIPNHAKAAADDEFNYVEEYIYDIQYDSSKTIIGYGDTINISCKIQYNPVLMYGYRKIDGCYVSYNTSFSTRQMEAELQYNAQTDRYELNMPYTADMHEGTYTFYSISCRVVSYSTAPNVNNTPPYTLYESIPAMGGYSIILADKCAKGEHYFKENINPVLELPNIWNPGTIFRQCNVCGLYETYELPFPNVSANKTSFTYNGKSQIPTIKVTNLLNETELIDEKYYKINYPSSSINVGKYTINIAFDNIYYKVSPKEISYTILPKNTSITKLTPKSKSVVVKWNKQTTQTTGYQIQYSQRKEFPSGGKKTVTVSGNKKTSYTIKKLQAKKKYYFKIRTYKTVNGKKYYSAWSKLKTATVKK